MSRTLPTLQQARANIDLLRPEDFASWDGLVSRSPHGTVFHNSWWLRATGCEFEILACRDEKGQLVAGIPLPHKTRACLTLFHPPMLTPYLGPIFDLSRVEGIYRKLSLVRRLGESLARAIKGYDSFRYWAGASAPDLQGFLWAGFRAELGYTFLFEVGSSTDQILEGITRQQKANLTKAERSQTMVTVENKIDSLMELNKETFARQGLSLPYPESLPRRLWAAADSHGQGNIYLACDPDGVPAAGLLVVHDARCSYQLVSGVSLSAQSTGGCNLVEWHAIQNAVQAGRAFDFEGSSIRGVERYYRRWGAIAKPVCRLEKAGSLRGALVHMLGLGRNGQQKYC